MLAEKIIDAAKINFAKFIGHSIMGITIFINVPLSFSVSISIDPIRSLTRSEIPDNPNPWLSFDDSYLLIENPLPLSEINIETKFSVLCILIIDSVAYECLIILLIAS
jgi:hypothetical protein